MKLFILTAALSLGLNAMAAPVDTATDPAVSPRVLKTFNEVFAGASDVQWNKTADYNEASFTMGTVNTRVMIDNSGKLVRTIRYYKGSQLPSNVLYKVTKKYEGKEVYGVTEVTSESGTTYNIVVRDDKNIYNVSADAAGNMSQAKKFKRGDL